MNRKIHFPLLLILIMLLANFAYSQSDKFAYTVTDSVREGVKWNFLRRVDLRTGKFSGVLLRLLDKRDTVLCNGIAAIALDDKNKRLYYTPMLQDRLSYVDLKTMRTHVITNNFTGLLPKATDQSNIITRMVITNEDKGYALTNDANHLIQFNTRNNRIQDLGPLTDAKENIGISVHEVCSSYGGDIISAGGDILYLITLRNKVFKINIETKIAKYLGTITGLPENFTTSGAAVDFNGNRVVIGSSVDTTGLFSVELKTLLAKRIKAVNPWHTSDLANGNSFKNKREDRDDDERGIFVHVNNLSDGKIKLYPNPVFNNEFKIQFVNTELSRYTMEVIDVLGQIIVTQMLNTGMKSNTAFISLPASTGKGILVVRITDEKKKLVFSGKILVQ